MAQPQAGIIPEPNPYALFLILRVREPAANGPAVTKIAAQVPTLVKKVGGLETLPANLMERQKCSQHGWRSSVPYHFKTSRPQP